MKLFADCVLYLLPLLLVPEIQGLGHQGLGQGLGFGPDPGTSGCE